MRTRTSPCPTCCRSAGRASFTQLCGRSVVHSLPRGSFEHMESAGSGGAEGRSLLRGVVGAQPPRRSCAQAFERWYPPTAQLTAEGKEKRRKKRQELMEVYRLLQTNQTMDKHIKRALAQHLAPEADPPESGWLSSVLQRGGATSAQLRGGFAELNATVLRIPHVVSTLAHEASPSSTAERSHERSCKTARQPAPAGPNMRTTATTSPRCRTQPNHHKRAAGSTSSACATEATW